MRNSLEKSRIGSAELIFFLIGALLLLALARVANGQSAAPGPKTLKAHTQAQQLVYREYRGVRLGMAAAEVRTKLGEPTMKSDEQDFYVVSPTETAQIAYDAAQKVTMISADYTGAVGAPDYKTIVGEGMLLEKPDGSRFRMVMYDSEHFWVSYHKSAAAVPIVTITIGAIR